jgi:hypothetical protein
VLNTVYVAFQRGMVSTIQVWKVSTT